MVLATEGGPRERHTEHPRVGTFPEWPRPHPRPTQTPSRVEPPTRKGVPRCSEDAAAAIVVLVTFSPAPSRAGRRRSSEPGVKWHSRTFFLSYGRRERGRSLEAASQWAGAPALSPASAELLTPRLPPPPAPQPPACFIPPDALGSCGCSPRSAALHGRKSHF